MRRTPPPPRRRERRDDEGGADSPPPSWPAVIASPPPGTETPDVLRAQPTSFKGAAPIDIEPPPLKAKVGANAGANAEAESAERTAQLHRRATPEPGELGRLVSLRPLPVRPLSGRPASERRRRRRAVLCDVTATLRRPVDLGLIALYDCEAPREFSSRARDEAEAARLFAPPEGEDLTDLPFVTIDPVRARDHDDAVFADLSGGAIRIVTAIADVSHYVRPETALDREARLRGNAIYLADRAIPMLPEALSSDICSLRANAIRPCLAASMTLDDSGCVSSSRFFRGKIRSRAALSYEQVQAWRDGREHGIVDPEVEAALHALWGAYESLAKARDARRPLEIDMPEYRVDFDDEGHVVDLVREETLESHRLIEAYMIAANAAAAERLHKSGSPALYRIHDRPGSGDYRLLARRLKSLTPTLRPPPPPKRDDDMKPQLFNELLRQAEGDRETIGMQILRAQTRAVYGHANRGHFGLNLPYYTHFTSPIRRYSDLVVHRALIAVDGLDVEAPDQTPDTASGGATDGTKTRKGRRAPPLDADLGDHLSFCERRAARIELSGLDRFAAWLLRARQGEIFKAVVVGIERSGLFIRLDGLGASGLIPRRRLSDRLHGDDFTVDPSGGFLIGRFSGAVFRLGDALEARLLAAEPFSGALLFDAPDDAPDAQGRSATRRGRAPNGKKSRRSRAGRTR